MLILLLQRINEKPQVVNDYEAGRAIPNQQVMGKLERALGELIYILPIAMYFYKAPPDWLTVSG